MNTYVQRVYFYYHSDYNIVKAFPNDPHFPKHCSAHIYVLYANGFQFVVCYLLFAYTAIVLLSYEQYAFLHVSFIDSTVFDAFYSPFSVTLNAIIINIFQVLRSFELMHQYKYNANTVVSGEFYVISMVDDMHQYRGRLRQCCCLEKWLQSVLWNQIELFGFVRWVQ